RNTSSLPKFIFDNCKLLYQILKYHLVSIIIDKLKVNSICVELKRILEPIDTEIIYTGKRTCNIILFEILFGFFIKKDQYTIYINIICQKLFYTYTYAVEHMLMGCGKSSVIVTLLTFYYYFINTNIIKNIVLVMPQHLTKQA